MQTECYTKLHSSTGPILEGVVRRRTMRVICSRCTRPEIACVCHGLPEVPLSTNVSILVIQTAAEAKCKIGTAWLLPHVLTNCTIHPARGHSIALATLTNCVLLFPGVNSVPITTYEKKQDVKTVVIIDGTWQSALRMLTSSSLLGTLPQVYIPPSPTPTTPLFRIRRPPTDVPGAVSTAEACAFALETLDSAHGEECGRALRHAVHTFSEVQLNFIRSHRNITTQVPHRTERRGYVAGLYEAPTGGKEEEHKQMDTRTPAR